MLKFSLFLLIVRLPWTFFGSRFHVAEIIEYWHLHVIYYLYFTLQRYDLCIVTCSVLFITPRKLSFEGGRKFVTKWWKQSSKSCSFSFVFHFTIFLNKEVDLIRLVLSQSVTDFVSHFDLSSIKAFIIYYTIKAEFSFWICLYQKSSNCFFLLL